MTAHIEIPRSPSNDGILGKLGFDRIKEYLLPIPSGFACRARCERSTALTHILGVWTFTVIQSATSISGATVGVRFPLEPVLCGTDEIQEPVGKKACALSDRY